VITSLNDRLVLSAAGATGRGGAGATSRTWLVVGLIAVAPAFSAAAEPAEGPDSAAPQPAEPGYSPEVVVTATRTARAIDHIPGSVVSIGGQDLENIQLSSLDTNEVLAQAIPGYTASFDDLTTSGELLRGKRPQFFLDGVLVSTPLRDIGRMSSAMVDLSYGSLTLGCSNLLNTFQIVNETGTSNITCYAIQARKYTLTYQISF
jgi:outer membrane receptor protein involved in Fe transport